MAFEMFRNGELEEELEAAREMHTRARTDAVKVLKAKLKLEGEYLKTMRWLEKIARKIGRG